MNMSADPKHTPEPKNAAPLSIDGRPANPTLRYLKWGLGALLLAGLAWLVWEWANDMSGVRREAPKVPAIIPLPPPPPPPPEKPPEPEQPVEEEKIVEPEPQPELEEVKPQEEAPPSPADDLADPMQMDGDAQSGSDAFNIGAGKGGGMAGSGGGRAGNASYSQYLAYAFQRLLRDNPELRNLAFRLQAEIWLSSSGDSHTGRTDPLQRRPRDRPEGAGRAARRRPPGRTPAGFADPAGAHRPAGQAAGMRRRQPRTISGRRLP